MTTNVLHVKCYCVLLSTDLATVEEVEVQEQHDSASVHIKLAEPIGKTLEERNMSKLLVQGFIDELVENVVDSARKHDAVNVAETKRKELSKRLDKSSEGEKSFHLFAEDLLNKLIENAFDLIQVKLLITSDVENMLEQAVSNAVTQVCGTQLFKKSQAKLEKSKEDCILMANKSGEKLCKATSMPNLLDIKAVKKPRAVKRQEVEIGDEKSRGQDSSSSEIAFGACKRKLRRFKERKKKQLEKVDEEKSPKVKRSQSMLKLTAK